MTVAGEDVIVTEEGHFAELDGKAHTIVEKKIITTAGLQIDVVRDVDFDPADGTILGILTDDQPVDGRSLLGVWSYAVIVKV